MRVALLAVGLTLLLGFSVAASFFIVGGRPALTNPDLVGDSWAPIYTLVAAFAAAIGLLLGYFTRSFTRRMLLTAVVVAWVGEYLVLASGVLADELNPIYGLFVWITATAGPLQPLAALAGAWLARRLRGQRLESAE